MRITIVLALFALGVGCSDAHAPVCGRASMGQLDTHADAIAAVAPDEAHVAFLRDAVTVETGCPNRGTTYTTGTLVVASLHPDGSTCEREVASNVSQNAVAFSGDSRGLAFRQVDSCGRGNLATADADGGNVRVVAAKVHSSTVIGTLVAYEADGDATDFAVPIGGGVPVSLRTENQGNGPIPSVSPNGTAFARKTDGTEGFGVEPGSLVVVQLPSGRPRTVVDATKEGAAYPFQWSRRGQWLAFEHYPIGNIDALSLALVAADGTSRTEVSASCRCRVLAFAPDDSWLAYDEVDGAGGVRLMTHSLKDGSSVALGMLAASDYPRVQFSDDGVNVLALVTPASSVLPALYAGTAGVAGSLQQLAQDVLVQGGGDIDAAGGHVAFPFLAQAGADLPQAMIEVLPLSGGAPVTFAGSYPHFEPGVSDPHLLFSEFASSAIGVARGDGTGAVFQTLSQSTWFVSWVGSTVVYAAGPSDQALTLTAITNAGSVSIELARGISAYAWAPIPAPTRLLYSRAASSADGPTGLWIVDLPR